LVFQEQATLLVYKVRKLVVVGNGFATYSVDVSDVLPLMLPRPCSIPIKVSFKFCYVGMVCFWVSVGWSRIDKYRTGSTPEANLSWPRDGI
jgi:hypothetical protein